MTLHENMDDVYFEIIDTTRSHLPEKSSKKCGTCHCNTCNFHYCIWDKWQTLWGKEQKKFIGCCTVNEKAWLLCMNYCTNPPDTSFHNTQPTKCTIQFLRYSHYSITLNIPTCFNPQWIIIREPNKSNST